MMVTHAPDVPGAAGLYPLEIIKMVKCMLCIFYLNKEKRGKKLPTCILSQRREEKKSNPKEQNYSWKTSEGTKDAYGLKFKVR